MEILTKTIYRPVLWITVCTLLGFLSYAQENETEAEGRGLFPLVLNLASRAHITTNATCGETGPQRFCKLVQHVKRQNDTIQCGVCDARSDDDEQHPIQNAIDGSQKWWQSPSIWEGSEYQAITITLDLRQVYQVAYVIVKAANSPRPGNWILERSVDGRTWSPWHYFALSRDQCKQRYGVKAQNRLPKYQRDNEAICASRYSRLNPLENGEIYISLVNGRPGVEGPSEELLEFTQARYVRLRLQRIRTLHADLMSDNLPSPSVSNRYFYSIKDISIGGNCICNGHASVCPYDPVTGDTKCDCKDNTCGNNCEVCCPLFNQNPYKAGTYAEGVECEECNCYNHADSCVYNATVEKLHLSLNMLGYYQGGGVCEECQDNTMGVNCELCVDGYYRPLGVDHRSPDPCVPCNCDGPGSQGVCVKDDTLIADHILPGDCVCREGYCGPDCSDCAPGYQGYPDCQPCPCNAAGSLNVDLCDEMCICKLHVCGDFCDECLPGYYDLQKSNPDGCSPCFCFGVTDQCHSAQWRTYHLTSLDDWRLTDLAGSSALASPRTDTDGSLFVDADDMIQLNRAIYWTAPEAYKGNKISSYGGVLEYVINYQVNTSTEDGYLANYDVILEGGGGMRLGHSGRYFPEDAHNHVLVNMTEHGWRHLDRSTEPRETLIEREQFMVMLARIESMLVRASYHEHQTQARLIRLGMSLASEDDGFGPYMSSVELCECPPGYAGSSCELCATGYRRVGNILVGGTCEPCDCNGYSDTCDPITGHCLDCEHHTGGPHCEQCATGYTGFPRHGLPNVCEACACPLTTNSFATNCRVEKGQTLCLECLDGYEGARCEICSPGYYGNPLEPGNRCRPCSCNGNMRPDEHCHGDDGLCNECIHNTEGHNCERCKEGYYGTAVNGDCTPCQCSTYGSDGDTCNPVTGQCRCKPLYDGRDCGMCVPGFGNIVLDCPACNCSLIGGGVCDPVTGQCPCNEGQEGLFCEYCASDHWYYTPQGCTPCSCHPDGSLFDECDEFSGICDCRPGVMGTKCDQCQPGFWGLSSSGCSPCRCDQLGSYDALCDELSGQCRCQPGVGGRTCDHCQLGFYDFTVDGCKECGSCLLPGQVCDAVTGKCICPANTEGQACERCIPDTWGYDAQQGCKFCNCSDRGSAFSQCDAQTGQCPCISRYTGPHCDTCLPGHYDFPRCRPCECDPRGTQTCTTTSAGDAREETCQCDSVTGECQCKEHVTGDRCDTCMRRSFSLHDANPKGCTECFCFGRSSTCGQAPLVREKEVLANRLLTVIIRASGATLWPSSDGLLVVPSSMDELIIAPEHADKPLYLDITQFAGDRTTIYGGSLQVELQRNGYVPPKGSQHSDLTLMGNFVLRLEYIGGKNTNSSYKTFTFTEEKWRSGSLNVNRARFMAALQNAQSLLLKLADSASVETIDIRDLRYDIVVPGNGPLLAYGVEECDCPSEYIGLSCQNPADGYYRLRPPSITIDMDPLDLVGESHVCACNQHSDKCDRDTGICQNCLHHTTGNHCELCNNGYFGNTMRGTENDCQPCACPTVQNSRSPTCYSIGAGEHICDACSQGYAGFKCDQCAPGYYGDPDSGCMACECNVHGSVSDVCDEQSGQCLCYPGILGLKCDECGPRHVALNGSCYSCDDGCTGLIWTELDHVDSKLARFNSSAEELLPWAFISKIDTDLKTLTSAVSLLGDNEESTPFSLPEQFKEVQAMFNKAEKRLRGNRAGMAELHANDVKLDAESIVDNLQDTEETVKAYVTEAVDTVSGKLASESFNLESAVADAENILQEMNVTLDVQRANQTLQDALSAEDDVSAFTTPLDISPVQESFSELKRRLTDLAEHSAGVNRESSAAQSQTQLNRATQERIEELVELTEDAETKARQTRANAIETLDNANTALNADAARNMVEIDRLKGELDMDSIGKKSNLLEEVVPPSQPDVMEAVRHADELDEQAKKLNDQFAGTKELAEDPLKAVQVYDDMRKAIWDAEEATAEAAEASKGAVEEIRSQGDIMQNVADAEQKSRDAAERAQELQNQTRDLGPELEAWQGQLNQTEEQSEEIQEWLERARPRIHNVTKGPDIPALLDRASDIMDRVDAFKDIPEAVLNDTARLAEKLREIEERTEVANTVHTADATVKAASEELGELENVTRVLENKVANSRQLGQDISDSLNELRDRIQQARAQAQSLKISLYNKGGCERRYAVPLQPASSNDVQMYFQTKSANDNMALMLINSRRTGDYLAVELLNRNIRLTWNAGSGEASVLHPLQIEDSTWYGITVSRLSLAGKLVVLPVGSPDDGTGAVEVTAPEGSSVLGFDDSATDVFVGGIPPQYALPDFLGERYFSGCVGEVTIDSNKVGMFNFAEKYGDGCEGCEPVPVPELSRDTFHFTGEGYAQLPQIPLKPNTYSIQFEFRVFWDEAMLFFTGNQKGAFMSVELEGGRVIFKFSIDGVSTASVSTRRRYNTNKWVKLRAARVDNEGILEVGRESQIGAIDNTNASLSMEDYDIYFGGVPATLDSIYPGGLVRSLAGCIKNVQLSSRGQFYQDLMLNQFVGVQPHCTDEAMKVVGLEGDGYLELTSADLLQEAELSLTFRTVQENSLLLLSRGRKNFYSISLRDGMVNVWLDVDGDMTQLISKEAYNDGYFHTITLNKQGTSVELRVDDTLVSSGTLAANVLDGMPSTRGLYIGGIPLWMFDAQGTAASLESLLGCIRDIVLNGEIRLLAEPQTYSRADVGRCDASHLFPGLAAKPTVPTYTVVLPQTTSTSEMTTTTSISTSPTTAATTITTTPAAEQFTTARIVPETTTSTTTTPTTTTVVSTTTEMPTSCAEGGFFSVVPDAMAFGDILNSHAEISVKRKELVKNFNLRLEFRTFYEDGLLFYITNDEKTDFVAVQLLGGRVEIVYKGNTLVSGRRLGDGGWHQLNVTKEQREIRIQVDSNPITMAPITRKVPVIAPMYVGGLPQFYDAQEGLVTESFKGCLRGLQLNSNPVDVANSKSIMGVRPCFAKNEPGVHFDGYGYAVYDDRFHIVSNFKATFEFRTIYQSGVIIAISSASGNPAMALEMHEGRIVFTAVNDGGTYSATAGECPHCLCDNQWHHVEAELIKNVLTLRVDDGLQQIGVSPGYDRIMDTDSALYIAGFPIFDRPDGAIHSGDFFHGCIRNLSIDDSTVNWHSLNSLVDIHVDGCPIDEEQ